MVWSDFPERLMHIRMKFIIVYLEIRNSIACQAQIHVTLQSINLSSVCTRETAAIAPIDHSMIRFSRTPKKHTDEIYNLTAGVK